MEITRAREKSWKELCEEVDKDIWGLGYKIVTKKIHPAPPKLTNELEGRILDTLFPQTEEIEWPTLMIDEDDIPLFTIDELLEATLKMKGKKAPGPDQITADILKVVVKACPTTLLNIYNSIIKTGIYPDIWKRAKVALLPKPNKPDFEPSSYRPLCLLDTLGKLLESLLVTRLNTALGPAGLSENQFGFRPGKSTVQAAQKIMEIANHERQKTLKTRNLCLLTAIDIKNAFNTASWTHIIRYMNEKHVPPYLIRCIQGYFSKRTLISPNGETRVMTAGAPQGSVIGPWLWNILYDGLLHLEVTEGTTLIAYADDLAIITTAKTENLLRDKTNDVIRKVEHWMRQNKLKIAPEKTEAALLIGRKKCQPFTIQVGDKEVSLSDNLKYLGIFLDRKLTFSKHISEVVTKADNRTKALSRIMPRTGGAGWTKRKLLYHVYASTILYATPVWGGSIRIAKYKNQLVKSQRKFLIHVARAYRTTSTEALQVVSGIIPMDIMINERMKTFQKSKEERKEERHKSIEEWERRWNNASESTTGVWTRTLIKDIKSWINRNHGQITYHLTQFLTGHGCFNTYLHRFKLRESPTCRYCINDDDAKHTFFECERWKFERDTVKAEIGEEISVANIVQIMLKSEDHWNRIQMYIHTILKKKEFDERIEEREEEQEQD
ncbi:hypothetical protein M8J77_010331 [Diaphorina citri]|nr:hypothetical protein M8J77_010331 [Diaphorina citri]